MTSRADQTTDVSGRLLRAAGLMMLGGGLTVAFVMGRHLSMQASIVAFVIVTALGVVGAKGILSKFLVVLYCAPFAATVGHLVVPGYVWWETPRPRALISDSDVVVVMMEIGLVGLIGLIAGMAMAGTRSRPRRGVALQTLGTWGFVGMASLSFILSWLSAQPLTIFDSTNAAAPTESINFNAAYLVSYIALVVLWVDSEFDPSPRRGSRKRILTVLLVVFFTGYFQLLRGDREAIGVLLALAVLYLTSGGGQARLAVARRIVRTRLTRLVLPTAVVLLAFVVIGALRNTSRGSSWQPESVVHAVVYGLQQSTWTAVLLTNLGIAGQYVDDARGGAPFEYLYGATYVDYALSLPPGPLAAAVGYERPLERDRGPNYWTEGISAGGIHVVLVPFKNFGIVGALLGMAVAGFIMRRIELAGQSARRFWPRLLYGAMATVSFSWFWYGDMSAVRGVMVAALLFVWYRMVARRVSERDVAATSGAT